MRKSGNIEEAEFVKLVREWFEAMDDKGIGSLERAKRIILFRDWLLSIE